MIITIKDVRRANMCTKGLREFCKKHNVDYDNFLKNGADSDDILKLNDAMANKVVEAAKNGRTV